VLRGCAVTAATAALFAAAPALAFDESGDGERGGPLQHERVRFKFTPTYYWTTGEPGAYDVNVRANLGHHTAWVGYYQQASEFSQARAGYEHTSDLPFGRVVIGAQVATQGFLGGAIGAEIGTGAVFGLLGFGRTNLKPYFNLNFDPNDAILFGGGWRFDADSTLSAYQIRDDRTGTGQRVTHVVARVRPGGGAGWSIDVFHRAGLTAPEDGEYVVGTGFAVTLDVEPWFVRVAWDPKVNFSTSDMLRVSAGVRF
jgi:hypothetical protein